mgnify:CR=1 FL=1
MAQNLIKCYVFKLIIILIRKFFPEGISFDEAHEVNRWSWTEDAENAAFHRGNT